MVDEDDQLLVALAALDSALEAATVDIAAMRERIEQIRRGRAADQAYRQIVTTEARPLVVELLSKTAQSLDSVGARVRRAEARALHEEGMTMEEIARHFGVTRQRVSAVLKEAANGVPRGGAA